MSQGTRLDSWIQGAAERKWLKTNSMVFYQGIKSFQRTPHSGSCLASDCGYMERKREGLILSIATPRSYTIEGLGSVIPDK